MNITTLSIVSLLLIVLLVFLDYTSYDMIYINNALISNHIRY